MLNQPGVSIACMYRTLSIIVLLLHFGCSSSDEVRIATASEAAFEASLSAMQRTLSKSERQELMIALLQIRMMGIGSADDARESIGDGQVLSSDRLSVLDGLTYDEIVLLAERFGADVEVMRTSSSETD
jgi:hypothetical protein